MRAHRNATSRRARVLVLALAALTTLASCVSKTEEQRARANGDDPMAALDATETSTRYGNPFWLEQSDSNTALWRRAKAYCARYGVSSSGQKANCAPVLVVVGTETIRHPDRRPAGALRP